MLLVTQGLEMAQSSALAVLAFLPQPSLVLLYALGILGGVLLAFDNPLRRSFVPEMVAMLLRSFMPSLPMAVPAAFFVGAASMVYMTASSTSIARTDCDRWPRLSRGGRPRRARATALFAG
jgi:hypothetical protein